MSCRTFVDHRTYFRDPIFNAKSEEKSPALHDVLCHELRASPADVYLKVGCVLRKVNLAMQ